MVQQTSNLAGFLLGCMQNDFELLSNSLNDVVIEPQRSKLIPGFSQLQQTALEAGALGFSISGSGPAMFALTRGPLVAKKVQQKLDEKCKSMNLPIVGCWNLKISNQGARLVKK
jgi:homoserine kinase